MKICQQFLSSEPDKKETKEPIQTFFFVAAQQKDAVQTFLVCIDLNRHSVLETKINNVAAGSSVYD